MGVVSISRPRIRLNQNRQFCRAEKRKAATSKLKGCDNFLNTEIKPIKGSELYRTDQLIDTASVKRLTEITNAFLARRHVPRLCTLTGDITTDVLTIINKLSENVDSDEDVEICRVSDNAGHTNPQIVVSKESQFDTFQLHVVPVSILDFVHESLRNILVEFFAYLWLNCPFNIHGEETIISYVLGVDYWDTDGNPVFGVYNEEDDDIDKGFKHWRNRYTKGDIKELLDEIISVGKSFKDTLSLSRKILEDVKKEESSPYNSTFRTMQGVEHQTKELFQLIKDGLEIMDSPDCISNYYGVCVKEDLGDDFEGIYGYDEECCFDLQNLFVFGYGNTDNDPVIEEVIDNMNSCSDNYASPLILYKVLDESGECDLSDDYPYRWQKWFYDFYKVIDE